MFPLEAHRGLCINSLVCSKTDSKNMCRPLFSVLFTGTALHWGQMWTTQPAFHAPGNIAGNETGSSVLGDPRTIMGTMDSQFD
jgi:hypothetical protein